MQQPNKALLIFLIKKENCDQVDSITIFVCKYLFEQRSKICKVNFKTALNKGYSAISKTKRDRHKLHLFTPISDVFNSMDLSKMCPCGCPRKSILA
jgi:hypothetical protein